MNLDTALIDKYKDKVDNLRNSADRWILSRINSVIGEVNENLDKFENRNSSTEDV